MAEDRIKIRLESYDHEALDMSAQEIVDVARRSEAKVIGPVPLPTRIERYTVLRSPHGDKKSREQFEVRTHKRIIYLSQPTKRTVDLLSQLNLPAGVEIKIRA
jgi:small subunit ribosomal protein S10